MGKSIQECGGFRESLVLSIAQDLAFEYHKGQRYGEHSYDYHLSQVEAKVNERGGSRRYRAVAWLHDILEDTPCTTAILKERGVPDEVIQAVVAITKMPGQTYEEYMQRVLENTIALEVKKCDTMCNLTASFSANSNKRILKYSKQLLILERGFQ